MSRELIGSVLMITVGLAFSLGCCCPARPPVVVVPQPPVVVAPPANPIQPQKPAQDMQKLIAENLGPNDRVGALAGNSPFWGNLRQSVEQRRYTTHNILGGGFGNVPFSDTLPEGGVLLGFFAGEDDGGHVGFLQPIYLAAQGEKVGQAYGVPRRPVQCLKAKTGYALGGIDARNGGVMDALTLVFMKVEGERVNPADRYNSVALGGQGGGPGTFSSSGSLLVGVHGKRLDREAFAPAGAITGMGFLSLP
jgi:hypothetical protein